MAEYPTYDVDDLAEISGYPVELYTNEAFVTQALKQATLLFKIGTCLAAFPDDELAAELAENGILDLANAIYWVQPFQSVLRNPFSSETIGSYSYSKLQQAVSAGLPTGVSWFDLAVTRLSVCDDVAGIEASGGINVHEANKVPHGGYDAFYGPAELYGDNDGETRTAEQGPPPYGYGEEIR